MKDLTPHARRILVQAPAKINLHLAVHERLDSGLHRIESIMQSTSLCNRLIMEKKALGHISFHCDAPELPVDDRNLALKAAKHYMALSKKPFGVDIDLSKKVPSGAGLGGGSADAAAVLRGLQFFSEVPLSTKELMALAHSLGSDVSFCTQGGLALVQDAGQSVTPLPALPPLYLLIAKPLFKVLTPQAFRWLDMDRSYKRFSAKPRIEEERLMASLKGKIDFDLWKQLYRNDFEASIQLRFPSIARILEALKMSRAGFVAMSGSGPSCYGLFATAEDRDEAAFDLERQVGFDLILSKAQTESATPPAAYTIEVLA